MPFEGAEKKLDLVIAPGPSTPRLRELGTAFWERVVTAAGARVLSEIRNKACTAFLLSESSLFVWDRRLVLITCGLTRPLDALEALGRAVPLDRLTRLLYQRRPEVVAGAQPTCFHDDCRQLLRRFPGRDVTLDAVTRRGVDLFVYGANGASGGGADALEILMTGIHPAVCEEIRRLSGESAPGRVDAGLRHRLRSWFDGFQWDEHWFTPPGFSANALRGSDYAAIHVTPQAGGSYASLETSLTGIAAAAPFLTDVLDYFRPATALVLGFGERLRYLPDVVAPAGGYTCRPLPRRELLPGGWAAGGVVCFR